MNVEILDTVFGGYGARTRGGAPGAGCSAGGARGSSTRSRRGALAARSVRVWPRGTSVAAYHVRDDRFANLAHASHLSRDASSAIDIGYTYEL